MALKMNFGVSTWLWTSPFNDDSISLFPKIKDFGFTHVEIPVEDPTLFDPHLVKSALEEHDLQAVLCGAFGPTRDLTHEDPKIHQQCKDYVYRCFDLCHIWDCEFVAGPMYSAVGKTRLLPPDERQREWDLAVSNLREICERAGAESLSIALEPLNRFESDLVNTASDVVNMVNDINHPAARVLLDSFHMTIEERDLTEAFKTAGDKLIHVQVSENYRGAPGTGLTNWDAIKAGLDAIDYKGIISIESFTPNVQELAGAVCIWKPFAKTQDDFAKDGLAFLRSKFEIQKT